ncbi:MAG: hypothetical protein EXR74_05020 [Bdellovibrionales bacterium]|nr:hypothetical protein [Bdellovibrionales bacterium]
MKIAIAQITAHADFEKNFKTMQSLVIQAKTQGAELICFPEMAYFSGKAAANKMIGDNYKRLLERFSDLAATHAIAIIPGTLREPSIQEGKFFNTLSFIDDKGTVLATYRKIFLYQAMLADRNYDETQYSTAGSELVTFGWKGIQFGFAICFDLRFPELFRGLKNRGAEVIFLPSAFTVPTGRAHWEILIRARAIENQFFMLAPGLTGTSGDGSLKYGHSLAIAPWGEILLDLQETEAVTTVEINPSLITEAEGRVPAWKCRRDNLFKIS